MNQEIIEAYENSNYEISTREILYTFCGAVLLFNLFMKMKEDIKRENASREKIKIIDNLCKELEEINNKDLEEIEEIEEPVGYRRVGLILTDPIDDSLD